MSVSRFGHAVVGKTNVSGDLARVRSAEQRSKTTVEKEGEISSLNEKGHAGGPLRDSLHDKVPLLPRANGHDALVDVRSRLSRRRRRRVGERLVAPRGRLGVRSLDGVNGFNAELDSVLESWCRRWRQMAETSKQNWARCERRCWRRTEEVPRGLETRCRNDRSPLGINVRAVAQE